MTREACEDMTENTNTERRSRTVYSSVLVDGGDVVLNEVHATRAERRDALVDCLRQNHDEVDPREVDAVLDGFGGADPDGAAERVFALYESAVTGGLAMALSEHELDDGPAVLYATFTDYGDGTVAGEMHASAEERRLALRERAIAFYEDLSGEGLPLDADEKTLAGIMTNLFLSDPDGRVVLFEARREAEGDTWRSELA